MSAISNPAREAPDAGAGDSSSDVATGSGEGRMSGRLRALAGVAVALTVAGAYAFLHRNIETTDDAQIDAEIVAIQTRVAGAVVEVRFRENHRVRRGEVLVVLDDSRARSVLAQAEAALAAATAKARMEDAAALLAVTVAVEGRSIARAALESEAATASGSEGRIAEASAALRSAEATRDRARAERERQMTLSRGGAVSEVELERAETALRVADANVEVAAGQLAALRSSAVAARGRVVEARARAREMDAVDVRVEEARARAAEAHANVEVARALRDLARLDLEHTRILAPADGVVSKKSVAAGQTLAVGSPVAQLVSDDRWVTANFKETQVGCMRPGQSAEVTVDAFPGRRFHGTIESLSGATGSRFTLLPPDNATGNFTKVVQRLSIRIRVHGVSSVELRPGMNVDVRVDTGGRRG